MTFSRRGLLRLGMLAGAANVLRVFRTRCARFERAVVQRSAGLGLRHRLGA